VTIPTVGRLRKHRLDNVASVLRQMRKGAALHSEFRNGKSDWWLTSGQRVDPAIAAIAIRNRQVIAVGAALFEGLPAQTYRFTEI
jgi:hypothetical protein